MSATTTETPADRPTVREALEANCRRRMADLARLSVRGWDGQRERDRILAELDDLLDRWNAGLS